jgi:hypothetical protein
MEIFLSLLISWSLNFKTPHHMPAKQKQPPHIYVRSGGAGSGSTTDLK